MRRALLIWDTTIRSLTKTVPNSVKVARLTRTISVGMEAVI